MTSVLHVIDRTCHETVLQVMTTLRSRFAEVPSALPVACVDPEGLRRAKWQASTELAYIPRLIPSRFLNFSPALQRLAESRPPRIIHAWGVEAAGVAISTLPEVPLVLTLLDPVQTRDVARWVQSFPARATVVAGSRFILDRLMEAGLAESQVVVIRGAADFGAINRARKENVRARVVGDASPVVLLSGPPSRGGGQEIGLWACAIVHYLHPAMRVLMPYESREGARLHRWVRTMPMRSMLIVPESKLTWGELAACADVFFQPAEIDICAEPMLTAMAAGLPVVATALHSIAEMIADRHNGLLIRKAEPRLAAARLLTAIEEVGLSRTVADTARGQAFEVFGVRAFADNYRRVYENLVEGRVAGDGVRDTAMVA